MFFVQKKKCPTIKTVCFQKLEPSFSEAEGRAERGIGLVKKKMNKKKKEPLRLRLRRRRRPILYPVKHFTFFFQIFTLMFLLFTPKSIYGLYYVPTLCKRHPDEIVCEKKKFFEEKLEFFEKFFSKKKKFKNIFFRKKNSKCFFFRKNIFEFFFFEKIFFDFNLKTTDWDRLTKYT